VCVVFVTLSAVLPWLSQVQYYFTVAYSSLFSCNHLTCSDCILANLFNVRCETHCCISVLHCVTQSVHSAIISAVVAFVIATTVLRLHHRQFIYREKSTHSNITLQTHERLSKKHSLVYDVVEKSSTRRWSRIPCVIVEKNHDASTWRRRCRRRKKKVDEFSIIIIAIYLQQ